MKSHLTKITQDPCHVQYKVTYAKAEISTLVNTQTKVIALRIKRRYNISKLIDLIACNLPNIYLEKRSILNQIPSLIKNSLSNNIVMYQNECINYELLNWLKSSL